MDVYKQDKINKSLHGNVATASAGNETDAQ